MLVGFGCAALMLAILVGNFAVWGRLYFNWTRATRRDFEAYLVRRGFALRPTQNVHRFAATREERGISLSIDVVDVAPSKIGTALRSTVREPLSDALVCRPDAIRLDAIGGLTDTPVESTFDASLRTFALDPAATRSWLGPAARTALLALGPSLREVAARSGSITLTLRGFVNDPAALDRAILAVATLAGDDAGRPDHQAVPPPRADRSTLPGVLLLVSFLALIPAGFALPLVSDGLLDAAAPLLCAPPHELKKEHVSGGRRRRERARGRLQPMKTSRARSWSHGSRPAPTQQHRPASAASLPMG